MAAPEKWYSLDLLDTVDLTDNLENEGEQVTAALPGLRDRYDSAQSEVAKSLTPVPALHPADDTWDDGIWFQRAMLQAGYTEKLQALEDAKTRIDELERSSDPGHSIAGYVLDDAHGYLKDLGLSKSTARAKSQPSSLGGLMLAEVIWQARNQHHHFNDTQNFHPPTFSALRAIITSNPAAFGLSAPPPDDTSLASLLQSRSFSQEILVLLGWTSVQKVKAGVAAIHL